MMDDYNTLFNQGFAHFRERQYPQAQAIFEYLVSDVPHPDAMRWLGQTLQIQGKPKEALEVYKQVCAMEPNMGAVHGGMAVCYDHIGNGRLAAYHYDRAMKLTPHVPDMRWNRALHLIANGDYAQGWQDYRWGYMVPGCRLRRTVQEEWDGREIKDGGTLFVWSEQGHGDCIQFSRYLRLLKEKVGPNVFIKFECSDSLVPLFADNEYVDEVISKQWDFSIPGGFDEHISLMSCPAFFGTTLQTIPWSGPYITPKDDRVALWREQLKSDNLKVGVVWRGAKGHNNDAQRNVPLEEFEPLSKIDGVSLFGLNVGAEPFPYGVDLTGHMTDFAETAAIVKVLDVVITVDTAMAHLAGAMAEHAALTVRPFVLLPQESEWRWGKSGRYTPWYPGSILFRNGGNNWPDVINEITERLTTRVSYKKSEATN